MEPIFDRPLVRRRRDRAAASIHRVAPILDAAAELLLERLDDTTRRFTRALDLGGRGAVAPLLSARGIPFVVSADLSARMAAAAGGQPLAADEEALPFGADSFDLVVASLSLHWVNDLPGALIQIRRCLAPDGLLLASLPGLGTLHPWRVALAEAELALRGGVAPRISPFPTLRDAAGLLQRAGFALPVADAETLPLAWATPLGLLRDLQAAGEANAVRARDPRTPPRGLFPRMLAAVPPGPEGYAAPLHLLMLTGWAPHASQQQPARPGSATHRLADALGTVEWKLGEQGAGETIR
jgi:SAM-dependent methyltransferase